jgi:metal-responsive CopG/Arc/MetJ family transcriptional regulator
VRTTVRLDEDVAAALDRLRRERGIGLSEAINDLIRSGLAAAKPARKPFRQRTYPMGVKIDLTNIGEVLEHLEGPQHK